MSTQQEVADLLKKLSDNSIGIAEAANRAKAIQARGNGNNGGGNSGTGSTRNNGSNQRNQGNQSSNGTQDMLDMQRILRKAQEGGLLSQGKARDIYEAAAAEKLTPESGLQNVSINEADVKGAQKYVPLYMDLLTFQVPSDVIKNLTIRSMSVQKYEDAVGDLNLDFYAIRISKLPTIDGKPITAAALFSYIRMHLNDFIDTGKSEFIYYTPLDESRWTSTVAGVSPVDTVFDIDIGSVPIPLLGFGIGDSPDNATVVCSLSEPMRWRFTTITSPRNHSHPVTGHREFGIRQLENGDFIVYTRGADRSTGGLETILDFVATWPGGDALWKSFQDKVEKFVNSSGGMGVREAPFSVQINWNVVKILNKIPQGMKA